MKKIFLYILTFVILFNFTSCDYEVKSKNNHIAQEKVLRIYHGKFAFCGASSTQLTGKTITIQGNTFLEGCAVCPVMEGPALVNIALVGNPFVTPDSTDKTVWSYFWYYDSVPQAPTWQNLPTQNRTFTLTAQKGGGMSNMWCMPCQILPEKVNGVTLAKCYGPINESALPLRQSVRALPGETSVTQAPIGASYPVGTIIPAIDSTGYSKSNKN